MAHGGTLFLDEIGDHAAGVAGEAPARAAGTSGAAGRRRDEYADRRARGVRPAPQPAGRDERRALP
ncbi:MAG: hypothetical protein U1E63_00370 [Burkholderiales bacterium]